MEKPDIFPAAMLTDVIDPAAKYSILLYGGECFTGN